MIGQVCHHFNWSFDYAYREIDWRIVQRMLIDAPSYNTEEKSTEKEIDLTEQSTEDIERMLEKYR